MNDVKAVIFDMDGVILDSETICDRVWAQVFGEYGLTGSQAAIDRCRGTNKTDTIAILRKEYGDFFDPETFLNRASELFHEIECSEGIPLMPYAKEILSYLQPKYTLALASSTRGEAVRRQLSAAGVLSFFRTLTTGDMVLHSKPSPEIYERACRSVGLEPRDCVAIEDSPNGIKSAHVAGLVPVMIPDKIAPTDEIRALCGFVCPSLRELKEIL